MTRLCCLLLLLLGCARYVEQPRMGGWMQCRPPVGWTDTHGNVYQGPPPPMVLCVWRGADTLYDTLDCMSFDLTPDGDTAWRSVRDMRRAFEKLMEAK